jgi:hypothetical protein
MGAQQIPGERELTQRVPEFSFLDRLANELAGSVCSVFGAAVERDGATVIPVAKARWGMGGGLGSQRPRGEAGPQSNVGAGGAAIVKPLGFIELSGGRTTFRPIRDPELIAWTAIAGGVIGLSALKTIAGARVLRSRPRLGRRRLARKFRRFFR